MPAAALGVLPELLALAAQRQVVFRPQQNEMVDHRRLDIEGRQLDAEVFRLGVAAAQEQADADLPRLAVLARPVRDRDGAIRRMIAERPFPDDMLQTPRSNLDAVLVADLQERPETRLQFARCARERPFRLQLAPRRTHFLLPQIAERGDRRRWRLRNGCCRRAPQASRLRCTI